MALAGLHLMNRLLGARTTVVCSIWPLSNNSVYSPGKKSGSSGFPKHLQSCRFPELLRSDAVGEALICAGRELEWALGVDSRVTGFDT